MRKLIAVTIALLMAAVMLSSGALAEKGKEHKGGAGLGQGQNQSQASESKEDKGNSNGLGHTQDKSKAEGTVITADDNGDQDVDAGEQEDADEDDNTGKGWQNGLENKNENKIKQEEKLKEGPNHGNGYGRVRNTQEVLSDIGQLAGEGNAAQLNTLMAAYREAKDAETAKTTLAALLDALTQTCTAAAVNGNVDAVKIQEQLALMEQLREKVMENAGNDNGTLLALMHAYENIFRVMNNLEPIVEPEDGTQTDTETGTGTQTDPVTVPAS